MTIEEAIKTAIEYENRVAQTYKEATDKASSPEGKKVFGTLAKEEQGHIDYLNSRLTEWRSTGHITVEALGTVVPSRERIEQGAAQLRATIAEKREAAGIELEYLQRALSLELETGAFYKRMVADLSEEGQQLFARFVEIEEGHAVIVQAEIDSVQGLGYWFDVPEWQFQDG